MAPAATSASEPTPLDRLDPLDLPEGHPFGPHNLPYGVFSLTDADADADAASGDDSGDASGRASGGAERSVGVRIGDHVLDAGGAAAALGSPYVTLLARPSLNSLLAAGRTTWSDVRRALTAWVTVPAHREVVRPFLHPSPRSPCTSRSRSRTTSTSTRRRTTPRTSAASSAPTRSP